MSVTDVLSTSVLTAALLGIGMFLVRTWGSARIEEKVRWDALRRASATAEFLATWVAPNSSGQRRKNSDPRKLIGRTLAQTTRPDSSATTPRVTGVVYGIKSGVRADVSGSSASVPHLQRNVEAQVLGDAISVVEA